MEIKSFPMYIDGPLCIFYRTMLLAVTGNGNAVGHLAIDRKDNTFELTWLFVEERYRNKGVATKLLNKTIELAEETHGIQSISLTVNNSSVKDTLIAFYNRFDFSIVLEIADGSVIMSRNTRTKGIIDED